MEETVRIPISVIYKLEEVLCALEEQMGPYQPKFLADLYRARVQDIEGRGKSLSEIKKRFHL